MGGGVFRRHGRRFSAIYRRAVDTSIFIVGFKQLEQLKRYLTLVLSVCDRW